MIKLLDILKEIKINKPGINSCENLAIFLNNHKKEVAEMLSKKYKQPGDLDGAIFKCLKGEGAHGVYVMYKENENNIKYHLIFNTIPFKSKHHKENIFKLRGLTIYWINFGFYGFEHARGF